MMRVKILSTSDVHGHVYPTSYSSRDDYQPYGMLKAATIIRQIQQHAGPDDVVIAIENGDWIQGAPFAGYLAKQAPKNQALFSKLTSIINYDAGVLGNHEFNYGLDYIRNCECQRTYPILGANIGGAEDQKIVDAPYRIVKKKGLKIAILGLTTAYVPTWEKADHIAGLTFESAVATAKHWVPKLKAQADLVVVAYHGGFEADLETGEPTERLTGENEGYQLMTAVPGIDALVTGHQHRQLAGVYHGVATTQPGEKGIAVGQIELRLDTNRRVIDRQAKLLPVADAAPDPELQVLTDPIQERVQTWLDQPTGHISGESLVVTDHMAARLTGHPYLQFINDVEMAACDTDVAATALFNDGVRGFAHDVTLRQVLNSYPYPNTLVVERLTGQDVREALERCASFFELAADGTVQIASAFTYPKVELYNYDIYSGIDYAFDLHQPVGQRVTELRYHGEPLLVDQPIDVAMNQYRGNGGGEYPMFTTDKVIREVNRDMAELIQDYFEAHPDVQGTPQTNFKVAY